MDKKDTQQNTMSYKGQSVQDRTEEAFYAKHSSVSFISKKTEKITTAIYMVTDFLPESEPLRIELRTVALSLMSRTRLLVARSIDTESATIDEVLRAVDDAITLLTLASTVGLISQMNGSILRAELTRNETELRRLYLPAEPQMTVGPDYSNVVLTQNFFDVELPKAARISAPAPTVRAEDEARFDRDPVISNSVLYAKKPVPEAKKEIPVKNSSVGIKIARRNDVLSVIKNKGAASIKDISSVVKDMGEKTVQRELLALVKEGVLVKEGEKRWSTYRIAS